MIDVRNRGLQEFPTDVILKGNLRWWAPSKPSDETSQAIVLSNRDLSLKRWIERAFENNVIQIPAFQFYIVDTPDDLPAPSATVTLTDGDRAYVVDIGFGQDAMYTWVTNQWEGPTLIGHVEKTIAVVHEDAQIPVPLHDVVYLIDATSGPITLTLPDPSITFYKITVKKIDPSDNLVKIESPSLLDISTALHSLDCQNSATTFATDGTDYYIIAVYAPCVAPASGYGWGDGPDEVWGFGPDEVWGY